MTPLPAAEELAKRLRSCIGSSIEPRLPFWDVRAIETEPDGSGVVLLETAASPDAPHWVATNRKPFVRRRDESVKMTMGEVHRMVLANARRLDKLDARLDGAAADFEKRFYETADRFCTDKIFAPNLQEKLQAWVKTANAAVVGVRASIAPLENLGLLSLESFPTDDLPVAFRAVLGSQQPASWRIPYPIGHSTPLSGGVESSSSGPNEVDHWLARRDGYVEVTRIARKPKDRLSTPVIDVVRCISSALGLFHSLSLRAGLPTARGRIAVEVLTLGRVVPCIADPDGPGETFGSPLQARSQLDRRDVGGGAPLTVVIDPIVGDFVNSGGLKREMLPSYLMDC